MSAAQERVLIVSGQEADREAVRLLLRSMGCGCVLVSTLEEAPGILNREPTTAAILDAQLATWDCEGSNDILREILLRLPGRIILLISEADDPRTIEFARAYSLPYIRRDRWAQELWGTLEALLSPAKETAGIKEVAQMVLDTFAQPQPAGVRISMTNTRHLLYETKVVYVDVSFELQPDAHSVLVGGQVLTKSEGRALQSAAIKIEGPQRPLGFATTNQLGEFLFEIGTESSIILEIEDRPGHHVTIHSPNLTWGLRDEPAREEKPGQGASEPSGGARG